MIFETKGARVSQNYNLLIGLVMPRPIAWVTSLDGDGALNAAPFSAYNYLSVDPPLVALGIATRNGDALTPKKTARNITQTKEFVINIVTEDDLHLMNRTAAEYPSEIEKLSRLNLKTEASSAVKVPRIQGIKAALECRHFVTHQIGNSNIILGEVVSIFVKDEYIDPRGPYIKAEDMHVIGRANGLGNYIRTRDSFLRVPRLKKEDL